MMDLQNRRPHEEDDCQKPSMEPEEDGDRIGAGLKAKESTIWNTVIDMHPHNLLPNAERIRDTRELDPKWKHPFTAIVAGPTGCGKTVFTLKFIDNAIEMIYPPPERVVWAYGLYQDQFDEYANIQFHEGLPKPDMFDGKQTTLLIIDDLMSETDDTATEIFTRISHHKSVSVLYLTQDLFFKGKPNRTISLNTHYMVLFKNPRDATQDAVLDKQMYPNKSKILVEAFRDATSTP